MQTHEKRLWKGPSRLSNKVTIDELNTPATLQVHNKVVYELPLPVIVPEKNMCRVALGTYSPPTYFFDSAGSCISKRSHPYHKLVCMAEYGSVDQCATRNEQE